MVARGFNPWFEKQKVTFHSAEGQSVPRFRAVASERVSIAFNEL
jgi:hypothetical protein